MNGTEKEIAKTLAKAFEALPDKKKEFLLGYAEGVAAMTEDAADAARGDPPADQAN